MTVRKAHQLRATSYQLRFCCRGRYRTPLYTVPPMPVARAIVLFARTPEAEAASKRLRVSRTAPLFAAVVASWLRAASRIGATPIVACNAADRERLAAIAPDVARLWIAQQGASFGHRLAGAAEA